MEKSEFCQSRGDNSLAPCLVSQHGKDGGGGEITQTTTKMLSIKKIIISEGNSPSDLQKARPKKSKSGHIKQLPYDILLDIFSRVPVDSVLECKLVCKNWRNLLTRRRKYFNNMHVQRQLNQLHNGDDGVAKVQNGLLCARTVNGDREDVALYYGGHYNDNINTDEQYTYNTTLQRIKHPRMRFSLPRKYLVGSCNGLVCLGRHHHRINDPIYICNPVTGDYTCLPKFDVPARSRFRFNYLARGFGYVRSTDEYKVVRIFFAGRRGEGQVQVYTLGSGCGWRNKKDIRFPLGLYEMPGIFANEAIYWVEGFNIYAFDLVSEEFQIVPNPPCFTHDVGLNHVDCHYGLVVLGGRLCFYYQKMRAPHMEIWSLKSKIWIKDFSIVYEMSKKSKISFWPILLTKKGEIIFAWLETKLYCYNSRTESWKLLVDDDCVDEIVTLPHVNTFVSLRAIEEKPSRRRPRDGYQQS